MTKEMLDGILNKLQAKLSHALGDRIEAVYLYGSRARGEARPDSDIDVLVVIRGDFDYKNMLDQTIDNIVDLSLEYDVVISRVFVSKDRFEHEMSPFLMNVRREALPL